MDFRQPYTREQYLGFFRNELLPEDFEPRSENIDVDFEAKYLKKITKIGEIPSLEVSLYEIEHISEYDPRVSISKESFRLLAKYGMKRALILFISHKSKNFRLSLVTIDLKWEEGKRVEKEYSNPRRYSFFLGPDSKTHTPEQYLAKQGRVKDFEDLKKRFSIEVVNKDFYWEIARLFTQLAGGKRGKGKDEIDTEGSLKLPSGYDETQRKDFTVRLIGRLVFCWFLKKKHSDNGLSLLPEDILSSNAVEKHENYYHSILEPLFFKVLNASVDDRKEDYKKSSWKNVPFLNGGLFTPDHYDFYEPGRFEISAHINTLKVPDGWLRELLTVFETYNFTIDENTTIDVELSIEPEMLGRIFENLLAEINPETGETARKATGSYYTPRSIVEFMVDESLKQYLITKTGIEENKLFSLLSYSDENVELTESQKDLVINALGEIKIIDPACGSGAFPMGILQKMLLVLQKVDQDSKKWLGKQIANADLLLKKAIAKELKSKNVNYIRKLGIIKDCIYGVDIQSIAVEIAKLRFFLSLIVDEKVVDEEENRGVKPLPNLEFKFVCANSLVGLPLKLEDARMFSHEDGKSIDKLKELREQYFSCSGSDKLKVEKEFKIVQHRMLEFALKNASKNQADFWKREDKEKKQEVSTVTLLLSGWEPFSTNACNWFDPEWMFGVKEGFDLVIANPPYVRQEAIKNLKPQLEKEFKAFYCGTADIYTYFYKRGLTILKQNGSLCFISPNKFMRAGYGKNTRALLVNDCAPKILLDFDDLPIFEATTYPAIIMVSKHPPSPNEKALGAVFTKIEEVEQIEKALSISGFKIPIASLKPEGWTLERPEVLTLMEKINKVGVPLGEYVKGKFYRGVLTGLNEAFVIDDATRKKLISEDPKSSELIKKWLRGRDIQKWRTDWADLYVISIPSSANRNWPWSNEATEKKASLIFDQSYPSIYAYLMNWREKLRERDDQGQFWWELRSCAYYSDFEKPKITWGNLAIAPKFALDQSDAYVSAPAVIIPNGDEYLLAILNSSICAWIVSQKAATRSGGFLEFKPMYIESIPVVLASNAQKANFAELVQKIIKLAKDSDYLTSIKKQSQVLDIERQINRMIYELYGFTKEEIRIVEESFKAKN